jgi:hypothetical protein
MPDEPGQQRDIRIRDEKYHIRVVSRHATIEPGDYFVTLDVGDARHGGLTWVSENECEGRAIQNI